MRIIPKSSWIIEKKQSTETSLRILGKSENEVISVEPVSGLVLDEIKRGEETIDEKLFTTEEAKKYFKMFKTEAREQALRFLERGKKYEKGDSRGRKVRNAIIKVRAGSYRMGEK